MKIENVQAKSILTKSNLPVGDYSANPYVGCSHACKYCYASFMKRFTNHSEEWGSFVDVKNWPVLKNVKKYAGCDVFIASVTDPYQPLEAKCCRTKRLLEELQGSGIKLSIATKSDLVVRDLELIKKFPGARVSWSINTLDEEFRREMDRAVSIERRLNAMKVFHDAGVRTTCFISPIFPGLSDVKAIIERARGICDLIWLEDLNLRGDYRKKIFAWIKARHPELEELYHEIYTRRNLAYWQDLDAEIREFAHKINLPYVRNNDNVKRGIVNYFYHDEITR